MKARQRLEDYDTFPHRWVSPPELADFLECDRRTILRMINEGSLIAFKVGRLWRIPISEARRMFPVELHQTASEDISGTSHGAV